MKNPVISVVVPSYNHSKYIIECLNSVYRQTFVNFECIIVDDGSNDDTRKVVLDFIKNKERFKYLYQDNSGVSKARNYGIFSSLGKFILPLDADDAISDNYLEQCFKEINQTKDYKIIYGHSRLLSDPRKKWNLDPYNWEDLLYKNMIHCSGLFRKEEWDAVGGYDENMVDGLEDWEFWINLIRNEGEAKKINTCKFYYRIKENSLNTSVIKNNYGYNQRLYIFNKHIKFYRKTNFYDMYFDNYVMKRDIRNPLNFLTISDLFTLLGDSLILKIKFFMKRVFRLVDIQLF